MLLIADSGSTKTDWRYINKKQKIKQAKTQGIQPYFQNSEEIYQVLQNELLPQIGNEGDEIAKIFFYGSGCSTPDKSLIVQNAFQKAFPLAEINVTHDLIAAARALCGHQAGISCILGTGANSCLYDGEKIISRERSLGFILGDEGSGAYLGKKLVVDFLQEDLPATLMEKFKKKYKLNREIVLQHTYKEPFPNRYFAAFTRFLHHHIEEPYCYRLIYDSFCLFFDKYICKLSSYQDYKIHFTGSIAFYFSNILRQVSNDKGLILGNIMETPIAGLTLFHTES